MGLRMQIKHNSRSRLDSSYLPEARTVMSESSSVNLFPAICLFLSCIFVLCLHWKIISRTLSLCHPRHWRQRWSYVRVRNPETAARIEEAIDMNSIDPDSPSEAASDGDQGSQFDLPATPLAEYFDPQTSVLHEHILEPPSPPMVTWERDLQHRIDNGRGLTASIDRLVDRAVKRVESAIGHA
ncbi:uncharacterized protein CDV56_101194 [Aspergillus thermomutatus]|uniref:Uncharacterized protein n=1 Tax=Aspergillus thermomutatus TaxID=41047 RepID=A0A397FWT9_ASPTH|nr:uncharacterized protein CDV56_101194 [Aspergillus thermomutatus]RHZ43145.1 hypothetical protein CDV56_101194 [Aspergillus thermomutatus]